MNASPQKPKLVLLAGLLCDSTVWKIVADRLAGEANVRMFSFTGFDSIESMASHVLEHSPKRFALAGHSMGGRVALEVFRQAPARVERLALLNTGVHPRTEAEVPGRERLLALAARQGMQAVVDSWLPPMMSPGGLQNAALMNELSAMVLRYSVEDFRGQIKALLNRPDATKVLPHINVPTLLLSGNEDNWSPVSQHKDIQTQIPNSSLVSLGGIGHMSTVEAPEEIAQVFRQWLGSEQNSSCIGK